MTNPFADSVIHATEDVFHQAAIVFLDETALQLQSVSRHTWAPRGKTPIHYVSARHDRMPLIGAVSLLPRRQRINTYFHFHDDNVRAPDVISFLRHLYRQQQCRMIVVLDRLNVHRSAVRQLEDRRVPWFYVEWLPAYAPDLNPVEAMRSCTKYDDLANFLPNDLYELGDVVDSLFRQRNDRRIKESYFHTARLDL